MSLIISKPTGLKIEKSVLERIFEKNKDGAGFCYSDNNQLTIRKVFKTFEGFYSNFLEVEEKACLIHFAEKDFPLGFKNFCGPFRIDENHVLIHTGDFWKTEFLANKEESQTANFVKFIKNIWNPNYFNKNYLKWIIEEAFDSNNLIVIMNNEGKTHIFNQNKGVLMSGIWYSEYPYKQSIYTPPIIPNRYDYNYPYNQKLPICSKCRFRCQGGSINQNGVIYCHKCNDERTKIIRHGFRNSEAFKEKGKLLLKEVNNDFLKEVLPDPELVDIFDLC